MGIKDVNVGVWKKMTSKRSSTNRRCDLLGMGLFLLEEVCHYEGGNFGFIYAQTMPSEIDHFLLSARQDVINLATFLAACLPTHHHVAT